MTQPTKIIRFPQRAKLHISWTTSSEPKIPGPAQAVVDAKDLSEEPSVGSEEAAWSRAGPTNPSPVSK